MREDDVYKQDGFWLAVAFTVSLGKTPLRSTSSFPTTRITLVEKKLFLKTN